MFRYQAIVAPQKDSAPNESVIVNILSPSEISNKTQLKRKLVIYDSNIKTVLEPLGPHTQHYTDDDDRFQYDMYDSKMKVIDLVGKGKTNDDTLELQQC